MAHRQQKLEQLQAEGGAHLEYSFDVDHSAKDIAATWGEIPSRTRTHERVRVAGRLVLVRHHGGLTFGVLRDRSGTIQLFVDRSRAR